MNFNHYTDLPVLLLSYNRPEKLKKVIGVLKSVGMKNIYLWSDGPVAQCLEDETKVLECRQIAGQEIIWDCRLETLYASDHYGCRAGVNRALDWFFSEVEEGIVLEDDCVPHQDFFPFCAELLEKYRLDTEVMCVSGDNSANLQIGHEASYSFTRYPLVWGWASWRRAWAQNDTHLKYWKSIRRDRKTKREIWPNRKERAMWTFLLDDILKKQTPDSWAYVWTFTVHFFGGLSVTPKVNLISNIGFGPDATHTKYEGDKRADRPTSNLGALRHPVVRVRDMQLEDQIMGGKVYTTSGQRRRELRRLAGKTLSSLGIRRSRRAPNLHRG